MLNLLKQIIGWPVLKPATVTTQVRPSLTATPPRFMVPVESKPTAYSSPPPAGSLVHLMRWGLVGMNGHPFVIAKPARPDAPWLRERVQAMASRPLPCSKGRDLAGAINTSLDLLLEFPGHRHAVIYIAAGQPTGNPRELDSLMAAAVENLVGIHGIYLGDNRAEQAALEMTCTKSRLGFGSFHLAQTLAELAAALNECIDALLPRPMNRQANRVVFAVDNSLAMAASISGLRKMNLVSKALNDLICRHTSA